MYSCLKSCFGWSCLVSVSVFDQRLDFIFYAGSAIFIFGSDFAQVCVAGEDVLQS